MPFQDGVNVAGGGGLFQGLDPDYRLKQQQADAATAFQKDVPTTDGTPNGPLDIPAMVKRMYQKGAYAQAMELQNAAINMDALKQAQTTPEVGTWSGNGSPPSQTPANQNASAPNYYKGPLDKLASTDGPSPTEMSGFLLNQGASPNEARMLTSAAASESGFNPNAPHDGGIGYGLFGHNGDRLAAMQKASGSQTPTWQQQAAFALHELRSRPEAALVAKAKSPDDLAIAQMHFERPQGYTPDNPQGGLNYQGRLGTIRRFWGLGIPSAASSTASQTNQPQLQVAQDGADAPPPSSVNPYAPPSKAGVANQSVPRAPGQGLQVAQNGASDGPQPSPPSSPRSAGSVQSGTVPSAPPQNPAQVAQNGRQAPVPTQPTAPPPLSPNAGAVPQPLDPSFGGQVPADFLRAGFTAGDWVNYARAQAALNGRIPNGAGKSKAEQWAKVADGLAQSIDKSLTFTPEQKNARDPYTAAYEQRRAYDTEAAKLQAQNDPNAVRAAAQRAQAIAAAEGQAKAQSASPIAEQEGQGKALGELPAQLASAANAAKLQNNMLDELSDAGEQFRMGPGATAQQSLYAKLSALGDLVGVDTSALKAPNAAYTAFTKLSGQIARQSIKDTGSNRAGVQELQFVSGTLPSPETPEGGLKVVVGQMKGLNDFNLAKQQAAQDYYDKTGSLSGFESTWNKNISPAAFVLHRFQIDQPEIFKATMQRMSSTPAGREILKNIKSGLAYGDKAGLF